MDACFEDEVLLLEAVFSAANESVVLLSTSPVKVVQVVLNVEKCRVSLTFELPNGYPDELPKLRLSCDDFSRQRNCQLGEMITSQAQNISKGQPMLLDLCTRAKEIIEKALADETETKGSPIPCIGGSFLLSLTKIDHMRDRKNYLKILSHWANDLSLSGRVLFCNSSTRRIFLILTSASPGNGSDCFKEFYVRLRSSNVDVDSSGRPCKERMATVLCPSIVIDRESVFKDFGVIEIPCADVKDLETFFLQQSLSGVYEKYIKSV